ncbi:hypothetical protein CWATWH0402_2985 [Crocosphaera watsonii WH 0402]|uniref:Uncharacterized protein n=1 Tax=Crocosphaera watsonii WH 0402 TaxID=1284629 RepID=T2JYE4_CROWT|nr:hypothetical protein [Crocosphaera watsonii]CCQ70104.1 hypothetical protein CWATWH0402_2985 [Crocosphaera watsonii WH 0402]
MNGWHYLLAFFVFCGNLYERYSQLPKWKQVTIVLLIFVVPKVISVGGEIMGAQARRNAYQQCLANAEANNDPYASILCNSNY